MATFSDSDDSDKFFAEYFGSSSGESDFEGFSEDDLPLVYNDQLYFRMVQSESDRENRVDVEHGWSREDSPPTVAPFTGSPGLAVDLPDDPTELDFFNIMFDDDMWETLVTETNRYAQGKIAGQNLPAFSRLRKWTPVAVPEMKVFMALTMAMGLVRKPDIADYFANEEAHETPFFSKMMSRDRFLNILSNLHLVNNEDFNGDRLHKLRPSFDEGTCPFKGKIVFRVYNPAKPNKFGIKLYQCCKASTGYIVAFDIYDGTPGCAMYSALANTDEDASQTTKIVVGLLARSGLLDKGHKVYLDNYYNSPELAEELNAHDTYMCGTVRPNRRDMPKAFPAVKLSPGKSIFRRKGNVLVTKFHEKRDVHMISTFHEATYTILERRRHGGDLVKPTSVVDYCKNMGGS